MRYPILCVLLVLAGQLLGQTGGAAKDRVEIQHADRWDFDEKLAPGAQRLIGSVRFKHAGAQMTCDSAYLFQNNTVHAFGQVRIRQSDTVNVYADRLEYDGRSRKAMLRNNVRLTDPGTELITEALDYHLPSRTAYYTSGASIRDLRDDRTLTSVIGTYNAGSREFAFSKDVVVIDPQRTIRGDTLQYSTVTGVARIFGPTYIYQGKAYLYGERGHYDTRTAQGRFTRNGWVREAGQELRGDTLIYDGNTKAGLAIGRVVASDSANSMQVRGLRGMHTTAGNGWVTGRAELTMVMDADTLFLHADTLFAGNQAQGRKVTARRGVRFFKSDLQGVCDTLVYATADSVVHLTGAPWIWSHTNQVNGDSVQLVLRGGKPHLLHAQGNAMLVARSDSSYFDQVSGTRIDGSFRNDRLHRLEVEGNCRTAYHLQEDQPDGSRAVTGVNRADCARLTAVLDSSGQVEELVFHTRPDGIMHPIDKAPPDALELPGFRWNGAMRPQDRADIFRRISDDMPVD